MFFGKDIKVKKAYFGDFLVKNPKIKYVLYKKKKSLLYKSALTFLLGFCILHIWVISCCKFHKFQRFSISLTLSVFDLAECSLQKMSCTISSKPGRQGISQSKPKKHTLQNISDECKDFVATWFPGFPLLSHPG